MNTAVYFISFVFFTNQFLPTCTFKSYPITTLINAKWNATPFALEISEYLADENQNLFWDYVNELSNLDEPLKSIENDLKHYKAAIAAAEKLISNNQISLMKLSLALHTLSPRIQANLQIATEVLKDDSCSEYDTFVNIGSEVICNVNKLSSFIKTSQSDVNSPIEIFSFDHVYPGSENNTVSVVLYGEIGTKNFAHFHKILKKQAENSVIKYVFRHYLKVNKFFFFNINNQ